MDAIEGFIFFLTRVDLAIWKDFWGTLVQFLLKTDLVYREVNSHAKVMHKTP